MAVEKELMQECSPEHLHMGTARLKQGKEIGKEGKKRGMNVERSTVGTKKSRRPNCPKLLNLVQSRQPLTIVRQEVQHYNTTTITKTTFVVDYLIGIMKLFYHCRILLKNYNVFYIENPLHIKNAISETCNSSHPLQYQRNKCRPVLRDGLPWVTAVTGLDKVTGQDFFFVSAVLFSTIILLFLLSSAVSLTYFNLAVPMRKCLEKYLSMSSPFSTAILNGTCSLRAPILFCGDVPAIKQLNNKQNAGQN